ncbi:MAG: glyoxylate/hydroxypyruvate reductase A [Bradyrhizobium sp.]|nr:MAG: glyoxylate/hydroxypyruvate reductase A [Bradyrhizobium sp.]
MTILIAIGGWDGAPWVEALQAALPGRAFATPETVTDRAAIRYAVCWRQAPGSLADLPNLQAIFSVGAGVDHLFHDPFLPQVPIVRLVDPDLRDRMGEWVVLQALLHHRQQRRYDRQQQERLWRQDSDQPAAAQVRVSIMGLGELGLDAARKLSTIGFKVAGWSRSLKAAEGIDCFAGERGLNAMLARSDILVALLPLTVETRGILNRDLFARLPHDGALGGPVLINGGRGGLQIEADILAALDDGVLKAASLDVFETEPLPEASPLWRHPNVYISPHNAAISAPRPVARYIAEQIAAHERGEPLRNVVDRGRGY